MTPEQEALEESLGHDEVIRQAVHEKLNEFIEQLLDSAREVLIDNNVTGVELQAEMKRQRAGLERDMDKAREIILPALLRLVRH